MERVAAITGSTRGLGFGLAQARLRAGCAVMISGRSAEAVAEAVDSLAANGRAERVAGQKNGARVARLTPLRLLWRFASAPLVKRSVTDDL